MATPLEIIQYNSSTFRNIPSSVTENFREGNILKFLDLLLID